MDVTINLSELDKERDGGAKPLLHTATTIVDGKTLKLIIDNGSDATVITKSCVKKLNITP